MSDALSRLPNPTNTAEVELDMRMDEVSFNLIFSAKTSSERYETRHATVRCFLRYQKSSSRDGREDARSTA